MNVTVENLAPCKKLVRIGVDVEQVKSAFEEVETGFRKQVSLPGFRPGKAPKEMVRKRYASEINDEVRRKLISDAYKKAVTDEKLNIVGRPDIEEIQFGADKALEFAATVETAPEFEVPSYRGLKLQKKTGQVTDEDIDRALKMLREQRGTFEIADRVAQEGDVAVVNFTGSIDGEPISKLAPAAGGLSEKKDFWVEIKPDSFIPGFGMQLIGAKAGEKRTVNVDFPADFVTPQLAGRKGVYEVEMVSVQESKLPEANDEFAKSFGAESLEKLRDGVRQDLQNELTFKIDEQLRAQAAKHLLEAVQFELPESAVKQETRRAVYDIVHQNQQRGISPEMIDEKKGDIFNAASAAAKDRVKLIFLFAKIAEKENIRVTREEMAGRIQSMAMSRQVEPEKLVRDIQKNDGFGEIEQQVLIAKVMDFVVKNAEIEDVA